MSLQSAPRRADGDDEFVEVAVDDVAEEVVDHGELDHATRRLLLKLLNGPYLRAEEHSRLWAALERNEAIVHRWVSQLPGRLRRRAAGRGAGIGRGVPSVSGPAQDIAPRLSG